MDFLGNVVNSNFPSGFATSTTPAEQQLRPLLCDDKIQVLSTFELNQVASLTYNDVTCDGIFEFITSICSKALEYTPLTLQKTLIVAKHAIIYGSEKTVNHAYAMQGCLQPLLEFNTVLMAQQQGGAMSFLQTLQGGAVDKGGPVREAAGQLLRLLGNINELRRLRLESASENSLVPVGDNVMVGFATDEVRHMMLKKKMAEEQRFKIQSNLKKSNGGFGGGYASKDGRAVVGAAHGIEEMIKMANLSGKNASKFSDDGKPRERTKEEIILEELKAEADAEKEKRQAATAPTADLLGSFAPAPAPASAGVDLLDFGGSPSTTSTGAMTGDLLGGGLAPTSMPVPSASAASADPFGMASAYNATTTTTSTSNLASSSLLDFSVQNDPFAPVSAAPNPPMQNNSTGLMGMTMNNPIMSSMQAPPMQMPGAMNDLTSGMTSISLSAPPPKAPMTMAAASQDRFSALDALAQAAPSQPQNTAKDAEARLLGFNSSAPAPSSSMGQPPMVAMGMAPPPPIPEPMIAPGSGQVATAYGDSGLSSNNNDGDNPWVMGGSSGMGLSAPSAPPPACPPPPPDF